MKRSMPSDHLKSIDRSYSSQLVQNNRYQPQQRKRKHNDSISESKLIKEKLPSSSLSTLGKGNVLIPRNRQNLENIDLMTSDGVVIKQLINNNNGDLHLESLSAGEENENEEAFCDSDSETVTGDESFDQNEESEPDE